MAKIVAQNQQDVTDYITLLTNADGIPESTPVVPATAGLKIWYQRDNSAVVVETDAGNINALASITAVHSDWDFIHNGQTGEYRVDLPDAAFLEGASKVRWGMSATGISGITREIIIDPFLRYQGSPSAVTALTTTFPAGTNPHKGQFIHVPDGTGIGQTVQITSVAGQVATHGAWPIANISATTSTIMLVAGDALSTTAALNADVLASSRSTLATSDLTAAVAAMLNLIIEPNGSITLGDALNAALAMAAGEWVVNGSQVDFKDPSGAVTRITATLSALARTNVILNSP